MAEFIQEYGSVFRNIEAVSILEPSAPMLDHRYIAAVDVATSSDFTVICVMDIESKEQVYLSRFNRVDYPELEARIAQIYNDWHLNLIIVEVNGIGKPVIDHLLEKGLNVAPFLTTHAVKSHIVLGLKSALEHSKVKLLNHEIQKKEMLAFEEKGTTNGSFSYSAPSGLHDDCACPLYGGSMEHWRWHGMRVRK